MHCDHGQSYTANIHLYEDAHYEKDIYMYQCLMSFRIMLTML